MENNRFFDAEKIDFKIIDSSIDINKIEFLNELIDTKPIILCGSFISTYSPTNIPSGNAMTKQIYNLLFEKNTIIKSIFNELEFDEISKIFGIKISNMSSGIPFEVLFEGCPYIEKIKEFFYNFFSCRKPNEIHQLLIELMANDTISGIITPNYDNAINIAAKNYSNKNKTFKLNSIVSKYDSFSRVNNNCFYVHGSVDDDSSEKLIVTLSDERIMPIWKEKIMNDMVNDRYVIIIGYSGRDFEICPVIGKMLKKGICKGIICVDILCESLLTYNIKGLLNQKPIKDNDNVYIKGDMVECINKIFNKNIKCNWGSQNDDFYNGINDIINLDIINSLIWITNILTNMGCVKHGLKLINYFYENNLKNSIIKRVVVV
jgi:hypothetical protein